MPRKKNKDTCFPQVLRELLEKERMTQKKLADYLGVNRQSVSLYCSGKSFPDIEQLIKIAEYFNVSIDFLLTGKLPENKKFRDAFRLSESSIENLQAVASGEFSDVSFYLDKLLSNRNFYVQLRHAVGIMETAGTGVINFRRALSREDALKAKPVLDVLCSFGEHEATRKLTDFFMTWWKSLDIARADGVNSNGDNTPG